MYIKLILISCLQLKELEKQIKQKDEKYNKTNEKCKEVKLHFNFLFHTKVLFDVSFQGNLEWWLIVAANI